MDEDLIYAFQGTWRLLHNRKRACTVKEVSALGLRTAIWKYYALSGTLKGLLFYAIVVVFSWDSLNEASAGAILLFVLAISVYLEHFWFYRPEMQKHMTLLTSYESEYVPNLLRH